MSTYSILCVLFIIVFIWLNISKKSESQDYIDRTRKQQMKENPHLYK